MLSELQQKRVWEGMLGSEIRANYFADLSGQYLRHQRLSTWGTLIGSSSAVVSVIVNLPESWSWLRLALPAVTAAISFYSVVMQNQRLSVDAADLHARWNRLARGYRRLWEDMYSETALESLNELDERATELSKAGSSFPNKRRTMLRWQRHVEQHHKLA